MKPVPFQEILVVGTGLMGTSLALAVKSAFPTVTLEAVEVSERHRDDAQAMGVFRRVFSSVNDVPHRYELVVLAVPPRAACALLEWSFSHSQTTIDLCSVKTSVCAAASEFPNAQTWIPSHPMAGRATGGPRGADVHLFQGRPWLFLSTHPPTNGLLHLVQAVGAVPMMIADAATHDHLMATVSHGIHVTSLSAMRASHAYLPEAASLLPAISGPAFWDITRLAASPSAFWVDTLIENRESVQSYINSLKDQLDLFQEALASSDMEKLRELLDGAKAARLHWDQIRNGILQKPTD